LIVDDVQLLIRAAVDGVGVTFLMEEHAAPYLANGQLVRVLDYNHMISSHGTHSRQLAARARNIRGRSIATGGCATLVRRRIVRRRRGGATAGGTPARLS
jgi:DNA-binding transcriptional LysR family regulator